MKSKCYVLYCLFGLLTLSGCKTQLPALKTPSPASYGKVDDVKLRQGFSETHTPWIVYSDRGENKIYSSKDRVPIPDVFGFMKPLMVVKYSRGRGMLQVTDYSLSKYLTKVKRNELRPRKWIPVDRVLAWSNALKNEKNGFNVMAAIAPNDATVLKEIDKYMQKDSALVFNSPDLTDVAQLKLPLNQLVYLYKKTNDDRWFLVGGSPLLDPNKAKSQIYGWVSSKMISLWGDRTSLKMNQDYNYAEDGDILRDSTEYRGLLPTMLASRHQGIATDRLIAVPPTAMGGDRARFFTNALDYSKDFVINVLGSPLDYHSYRSIKKGNRRLNVVFVMDLSKDNVASILQAKSSFLSFLQTLSYDDYFTSIQYGAVGYRNNCSKDVIDLPLSPAFDAVANFIDKQAMLSVNKKCVGNDQMMLEGLSVAGKLFDGAWNETNMIVLVGATSPDVKGVGNAIGNITKARARIVSFQTAGGSGDLYNNFVLNSIKIVSETAKNIAVLLKNKIVDPEMALNDSEFNLRLQDEDFYSLDYPAKSMSQGIVIYPSKGKVTTQRLLVRGMKQMRNELADQNKKIDLALTNNFKSSLGLENTFLKENFRERFPNLPDRIPVATTSELFLYNKPFISKGLYSDSLKIQDATFAPAEKGILLSDEGYEALRKLYEQIYEKTKPDSPRFKQSSAINAYLKLLRKTKLISKESRKLSYRRNSMGYSVAAATGFDNVGRSALLKESLRRWKDRKVVSNEEVRQYFSQFKVLSQRLQEYKSDPRIKIEQKGEALYWLNAFFMPRVVPVENLE